MNNKFGMIRFEMPGGHRGIGTLVVRRVVGEGEHLAGLGVEDHREGRVGPGVLARLAQHALDVPLERALLLANAAGALAVAKKGPMEGNSTMGELAAYLERLR